MSRSAKTFSTTITVPAEVVAAIKAHNESAAALTIDVAKVCASAVRAALSMPVPEKVKVELAKVAVRIPRADARRAKARGINVSKACSDALAEALRSAREGGRS